jgi:hypothetical protein
MINYQSYYNNPGQQSAGYRTIFFVNPERATCRCGKHGFSESDGDLLRAKSVYSIRGTGKGTMSVPR